MEATGLFTREVIGQHLSWLTARGDSHNTIKAYKADLKCLLDKFGEFPLEDFEAKASTYLNEMRREQAPKTVNRKLGTYRGFGRRFGIEDCLSEYKAPTPHAPVPHPVKGGIETLEKMHENAVAENNQDLAFIIALCGFQGLRLHEAMSLSKSDFDLENATVKVRGKGDKTRVIPLSTRVARMVAYLLCVGPSAGPIVSYSDRGARYAITRSIRRAGGGDGSSHDLRSTFATEAYRKSKDLRVVQEFLGHSSSKTTEGYTQVAMEDMRKAGEL